MNIPNSDLSFKYVLKYFLPGFLLLMEIVLFFNAPMPGNKYNITINFDSLGTWALIAIMSTLLGIVISNIRVYIFFLYLWIFNKITRHKFEAKKYFARLHESDVFIEPRLIKDESDLKIYQYFIDDVQASALATANFGTALIPALYFVPMILGTLCFPAWEQLLSSAIILIFIIIMYHRAMEQSEAVQTMINSIDAHQGDSQNEADL